MGSAISREETKRPRERRSGRRDASRARSKCAIRILRGAGIEIVDDANAKLSTMRPVVTDPLVKAATLRGMTLSARLLTAATGLLVVGSVLVRFNATVWPGLAVGAVGVVLLAITLFRGPRKPRTRS